MRITIIGGVNVDIITKSVGRIVHGDSNPAEIRISAGGVARNIAENLARSGAKVDFITAVGNDAHGNFLRENCERCGISTQRWIVRDDMSTGVYSAALDCDGELYAGFNAMSVIESIGGSDLAPHRDIIKNSDIVIADANLTEQAISAIVELCGDISLMLDTVSTIKAPRVLNILSSINILKMNRAEAESLTGMTLSSEDQLELACANLTSRGVKRIFITLGSDGVCAAEHGRTLFVPAIPVQVGNVTGAGDAFTAAIAARFTDDLETQARYGISLATKHLRNNS